MIKSTILLSLLIVTLVHGDKMKNCYEAVNKFKDATYGALQKRETNLIIDELQKVFETYPSLLESCGDEERSKQIQKQCPPTCSKLLSKEAKLLVTIMRLYSEDREKNKAKITLSKILTNIDAALFEATYKTKVQKNCPFLKEVEMAEVKNKGECAEGMYRLSLVFEQLDIDLAKGKFNNSLTDMGKVMEKIPDTLDSCSQHKLAKWFRNNFPQQCLSAIGGLVRELDTLEHNFTHIEWLQKHLKDVTSALHRVKAACPGLEH